MALAPLQVVDEFLRQYDVGQAVLVLFFLSVVAALPLRSRKILSINAVLFGVLFLALPSGLLTSPSPYRLFGIALVVLGPVLYSTARR